MPAQMAGADQAEPVPAEMTLDLVLDDIVPYLPERSKERGSVWEPTMFAGFAPYNSGLGRCHSVAPSRACPPIGEVRNRNRWTSSRHPGLRFGS